MQPPHMQPPHLKQSPSTERIVIFRALQLGDLMCTVPAWRALRIAHPHAEITLVGLPWAKAFVQRFDHYLDWFIEFPGYPGLPEVAPRLASIPAFLQRMQAEHFDLALQMHGDGTDINPLIMLFGARDIAGFYLPGRYCPDKRHFLPYPAHEPEVWRHLRLMDWLGIPPQGTELEFPLHDADFVSLQELPEYNELKAGTYVCLHVGARSADRCWPPERFALVGDVLVASGLRVVLTGTSEELPLTQAVAQTMRTHPINLAGKTSLGALGALLSSACLLVSNDTGVSHVADALQVPSVIIAGFDTPRWAPLQSELHRVVYDPALPVTDRVLEEKNNEQCLRDACIHFTAKRRQYRSANITVGAILDQVNDLLQHSSLPVSARVTDASYEEQWQDATFTDSDVACTRQLPLLPDSVTSA